MKRKNVIILVLAVLLLIGLLTACNGSNVSFKIDFIVDGDVYHTVDSKGNEEIKLPADPEKEGYIFDGWYWDKDTWKKPFTANSLLDAPLSKNLTVYAKWIPINEAVNYTITFDGNGGSETAPIIKAAGEAVAAPATPTKEGFEFDDWYLDNGTFKTVYTFSTMPSENITLYAKWIPINEAVNYTITFDGNGGSETAPIIKAAGEAVAAPATPTKEGFDFDDWYLDNGTFKTAYTFSTMPSENITLYAKWIPINEAVNYTITFDGNGGSETAPIIKAAGEAVAAPATPTKEGFEFDDWYLDNGTFKTVYTFSTMPSENITLYAKWIPINEAVNYTITFDGNGGSETAPIIKAAGEAVAAPATPTKEGFDFDDWYLDNGTFKTAYTFSTMPSKNITLYAKWTVYVPGTENLSFTLINGDRQYAVSGIGTATGLEIIIPSSYNGKKVVAIADSAFSGCSGLTSITIPNGVTSIGVGAFSGCSGLTSITLPFVGANGTSTTASSSTLFGYIFGTGSYTGGAAVQQDYDPYESYITYYIPATLKNVTITDGNILYGAFSGYSGLTSVTIGSGVTSIGSNAFRNCSGLTSVTIGSGVTSIGWNAFRNCSGLTSITIPNGVTSIESGAFSGCSGLTSITLPFVGANGTSTTASSSTLFGYIFGESSYTGGTAVTQYYTSVSYTTYYIPATLKNVTITDGNILYGAFYGCSGLTSVTIGSGVTSIGHSAFYNCSGLTSVYITDIAAWCNISFASDTSNPLYYAKKLYLNGTLVTDLVIPDNVTKISHYAFYGCSGLTSITIPDSVVTIGYDALFGTAWYNNQPDGLVYAGKVAYKYKGIMPAGTSITLLEGTKGIADSAFRDCSGLTTITIPDSVTSIGGYSAFSGCYGLTSVYITDIAAWCNISFSHYDSNPLYYAKKLYLNGTLVTDLVIPDNATKISDYAFYNCSGLTSITIPNSVTSIGSYAFCGCSGLTSITIPGSVTSIGYDAFAYTAWYNNLPDGLVYAGKVAYKYKGTMPAGTSITLKEGTTEITDFAFYNCSGLTSITIPDSVTSIGSYAFYGCSGLTSVTIGSGVTSIGEDAFNGCSGLTSITIPDSVTSIGESAFRDCSGLTSITIPDSVTSIGESAFFYCSGLTSITLPFVGNTKDGTSNTNFGYIFSWIPSGLKTVIITGGTSIGSEAFYNCDGLTSITIPDSVTSIGSYAFYGCSGLTSITIPNSVTSIGSCAFCRCSGLTSITIPGSVTSIGSGAFYGCSGLTSITIPGSVTSIGEDAFRDCRGLTSITIPDSVTSIGSGAFYGCSGLTSITLPFVGNTKDGTSNTHFGYIFGGSLSYVPSGLETVIITGGTSIADRAFEDCSGLTSITIPDSVTSIGSGAFVSCSGLTSITIPDSVTSIGSGAFSGCSGLTSITIPNSVTSIGSGAFYGCSGLTSVTIGSGVTSIGESAFFYCSGLTSITIPDTVTSIGSDAFRNCSGLTSITLPFVGAKGTSTTASSSTLFGYIFGPYSYTGGTAVKQYYASSSSTTYYIPATLKNVTITGGNILYGAFYGCSGLTSVTIPDSVTSIGSYAFNNCSGLTSVTIGSGVTSIGERAFFYCSGLTSITIPNSVTSIGSQAFNGCSKLTSVTIPDSVTSIGSSAFYGCSGLTSITISNSVTSIGESAFSGCSGLTSITLPFVGANGTSTTASSSTLFGYIFGPYSYTGGTAVKQYYASISSTTYYIPATLKNVTITGGNILYGAFYGCSGLTSITISNSVTSIGQRAFYGCSGLTSIRIPDSVTSIGWYAFNNCYGLTSVTIGSGVTSIGSYAFYGCSGLTSITIPDSVTSIDSSAFSGCSGLTSVTIGSGVTSIGSYAFSGCSGLTSITIPDSVTSIGSYAFSGCSGLTSITIPDSVTSIGSNAFSSCYKLVQITNLSGQELSGLPNNPEQEIRTSLSASFANTLSTDGDGVITYTVGGTKYAIGYTGTNSVLDLSGKGITAIYQYAFEDCNGLTSITIPDSVTSIGSQAFYNCIGLTSITIPDSITSIGAYAFSGTAWYNNQPDGLVYAGKVAYKYKGTMPAGTSITLKEGTKSITDSAFSGCSGLTSITLPFVGANGTSTTASSSTLFGYIFGTASYTGGTAVKQYYASSSYTTYYIPATLKNVTITGGNILYGAFSGCSGLTSVTIPDSVTSIGSNAFYNCSKLTSVTISNSVTSIGDYAFSGCSGLTSITIPDSVTSIGSNAFSSCYKLVQITNLSGQELSRLPNNPGQETRTSLSVSFANILSTDGDGVITYTVGGTKYAIGYTGSNSVLDLSGKGITAIYQYAFQYCSGLTSVTIGSGVTSIGSWAFSGCSGLTSITIPNSVTSIDSYAFEYCSGLTSVTIPNSVTSIGDQAFYYCSGLTSVTIGSGVTSIGSGAFFYCSGLTAVYITDIAAWCNISFGDFSSNPLYYAKKLYLNGTLVTDLVIPNSVTSIGSYAFYGCSGLTSITIPDSVTSIGSGAFYGCSGLTSITIPDTVTSIGSDAFYGNAWYNNQPDGLVYAGKVAYKYKATMPAGTSITIKEGTKGIAGSAFQSCSGLTSITIPDSVTSIGDYAFSGCSGLTSVTIPDSVTSIGSYAFYNCRKLTSITIPDSVTSIGSYAFNNCSGLTSVTIGSGVTSIGEMAFFYCSGLTSIAFSDTTTWYRTTSSGYTGGTQTDVTSPSTNATYFKSTYNNYYWYKE